MSAEDLLYAEAELISRNLQREAGDGANGHQESYIDKETPQENDGRSKTVTGFDPRDASNNRTVVRNGKRYEWWEWLNQLNDGVGDKDRGSANWAAGKRNDADLFCEHLDFNRKKTEKIEEMVTTIDGTKFGNWTTEQITVACCSLVADADTDTYEDRIILKDEFKELMESVGLGSREHSRIRQAIRERTDYF